MKTVLLVEDNEEDIFFAMRACEGAPAPHKIEIVRDGQTALDYLAGKASFGDRNQYPLPDLILLDIKLSKRNGLEVLDWIRCQPQFRGLPVVMLTGSDLPEDIDRAYKLNATSYLKKYSDPDKFRQSVQILLAYWLEINIPSNVYGPRA